jgi:hypothetical protein
MNKNIRMIELGKEMFNRNETLPCILLLKEWDAEVSQGDLNMAISTMADYLQSSEFAETQKLFKGKGSMKSFDRVVRGELCE